MVELESLLKHSLQYKYNVPILNSAEIDDISEQILSEYMPDALTNQEPVDIELLIERNYNLRMDYQTFLPDNSILGETIFQDGVREVYSFDEDSGFPQKHHISVKKGTIILDSNMVDQMPSRTSFTEAHELAHWTLHGLFYGGNNQRACRSFLKQALYFPHRNTLTPIEWTEWQANTFAAAILLPRQSLRLTLESFLSDNSLKWKKLQDFSQYDNRVKYDEFLHMAAKKYQVSYETVRMRMNKLCRIRYPR